MVPVRVGVAVIAVQIVFIVVGSLAVLTAVVFGLLWIDIRRSRRVEEPTMPLAEVFGDAEADAIVREAVADFRRQILPGLDDPTQEFDLVDPNWDRSSREIHHMTVPEFQDVNAEFTRLIERGWPQQT